ncbi:MAG: alpha/beta fold hydrolase [Mycobacteriales bacterium]
MPSTTTVGPPSGEASALRRGDVTLALWRHPTRTDTPEPPLVLVHGYTGSALDFTEVAPLLADARTVVCYDQRGHGASSHLGTQDAYRFDELVTDLAAVVAACGSGPVDLLGHSMGGVIAMRLALESPQLVRSLVLMDTAGAPAGQLPMDLIAAVAQVGRDRGMADAADLVLAAVAARTGGLSRDSAAAARRAARARHKLTQMDPEAFLACAAGLTYYPSMLERLTAVRMPVTVIVGAEDTELRSAADQLAGTIPGATLVVIPDAGHSPQEDAPALWVAAVEDHLALASA